MALGLRISKQRRGWSQDLPVFKAHASYGRAYCNAKAIDSPSTFLLGQATEDCHSRGKSCDGEQGGVIYDV